MKNAADYPNHKDLKISDFADLLYTNACDYADKDCYRFLRKKVEYRISFSEFAKTVNGLGTALAELGVNTGHTAVIGEKCYEWIASYFAAIIFGGVVVPMDKELAEDQIRNFINFAECTTVIYTKKYKDVFVSHEDEMPNVKHFIEITMEAPEAMPAIIMGEERPEGMHLEFGPLVRYGNDMLLKKGLPKAVKNQDIEKMSIILFTSGTTGTSKGVMLSQSNVLSNIRNALKLVNISSEDILVSVLPLHHTYEMTAGILSAFAVGCTVCINDNIKNVTRDFKYFQPTVVALVPLFVNTIYKRIMDTARKKGIDKTLMKMIKLDKGLRRLKIDLRKFLFSQVTEVFGGRLDRIICGGAPLSPDMVEKFDSFGITVAEGYGITECSPVIAVNPFEATRLRSCGLLMPNMQCCIDKENASDTTGEIVVKGENVMLGYYKNEEATREVLNEYGWFRTGDCGYIDKDNYLYITGRKKNVIVLNNGKNVFPEEIEEYLESIEMIKECTVVGRRSKEDDTVNVTAVIYPDYERMEEEGIDTEAGVNEYFKERIQELNKKIAASFKHIRNVEIRKRPFPKTTTQKIQRHRIDKE